MGWTFQAFPLKRMGGRAGALLWPEVEACMRATKGGLEGLNTRQPEGPGNLDYYGDHHNERTISIIL